MTSLKERALVQVRKLYEAERNSKGTFRIIRSREDLRSYLDHRKAHSSTAGFLAVEGAHPIENNLQNVNELFDVGVRVMSITHFFDNQLGGSAHGEEKVEQL